jgi:hypothetical protein
MARRESSYEVALLAVQIQTQNNGWRRREEQSLPYLQKTASEVWYVTMRYADSYSVLLICAASR